MSTIQNGYEYLIIRGLVESIPKSGYYVANKPHTAAHQPPCRTSASRERSRFQPQPRTDNDPARRSRDLRIQCSGPGRPADSALLLRTMQQVIRKQGAGLLRYYPPNGSPELRDHIIQRAAVHKSLINPDELLITDGALQALYIALASVCDAGDVIAVESPWIQLFESNGFTRMQDACELDGLPQQSVCLIAL